MCSGGRAALISASTADWLGLRYPQVNRKNRVPLNTEQVQKHLCVRERVSETRREGSGPRDDDPHRYSTATQSLRHPRMRGGGGADSSGRRLGGKPRRWLFRNTGTHPDGKFTLRPGRAAPPCPEPRRRAALGFRNDPDEATSHAEAEAQGTSERITGFRPSSIAGGKNKERGRRTAKPEGPG